ncbi:helix-turn-helix domain-containing protein, partial [Nonomuraea sp. NPDC001684]
RYEGRPLPVRELPADADVLTGSMLDRVNHSSAAHYDVPRAAEALSLHPNTLRYRLRRIGELIALDEPDVRLVLGLQLRLAEIGASGAGDGQSPASGTNGGG